MIEFTQIKEGEAPYDVRVRTDDSDAELAQLDDDFTDGGAEDFDAYRNLCEATRGEDGMTEFVIPGEEVGEVSDVLEMSENDAIAKFPVFVGQWNREALEAAEKRAADAEASS